MEDLNPDNLGEALAIVNHVNGVSPPAQRLAAEEYLSRLKSSPVGLRLAFSIVASEQYDPHRVFWAFNTLIHNVPLVAADTSPDAAMELYVALSRWLQAALEARVVDFMLNKHAHTMAICMQAFYPDKWPTVLEDLFILVGEGQSLGENGVPAGNQQALMYFLRVYQYIDEVVVDSVGERDTTQRQRDNAVKDAMRERCIERVVAEWYRLLSHYHTVLAARPELLNSAAFVANVGGGPYEVDIPRLCLDDLQRYVEWIDINLVVNPKWVQLLYHLLRVPVLRVDACECLVQLVDKKQLPPVKFTTLGHLELVRWLPQLAQSATEAAVNSDEAERFLSAVTRLVVKSAEWYLQITMDGIADAEAPTRQLLPVALSLLRQPLLMVRDVVLPFLQLYVKQFAVQAELSQIASDLFHLSCTPAAPGLLEDDDTSGLSSPEERNLEQRKLMHSLLRLVHRREPTMVLVLCNVAIGPIIAAATEMDVAALPFGAVEGAIRLLFELGETVRMDSLRTNNPPADASGIARMVLNLLRSGVLSHPHPGVHLALFEMFNRYATLFLIDRHEALPLLLDAFLIHPNGLRNPTLKVRSRICYTFAAMLTQLKNVLQDFTHQMIIALLQLLGMDGAMQGLGLPPGGGNVVSFAPAVSRAFHSNFQPGPPQTPISGTDRADIFEAFGQLIAMGNAAVLRPVLQDIFTDVQRIEAQAMDPSAFMSENVVVTVCEALTSLTALAKGIGSVDAAKIPDSPPLPGTQLDGLFPPFACLPPAMSASSKGAMGSPQPSSSAAQPTSANPYAGAIGEVSTAILRVAMYGHQNQMVRDRVLLFLQQIINLIGVAALPFVEEVLRTMLETVQTAADLTRCLRTLHHAVSKLRGAVAPIVGSCLLPSVLARVQQAGAPDAVLETQIVHGHVVSEAAREALEVYRYFFNVLHVVVHCSCVTALHDPAMVPHVSALLDIVISVVRLLPDLDVVKQGLQIVSRLVLAWDPSSPPPGPMDEFCFTSAILPTLEAFSRPGYINLQDAKVYQAVCELTTLLRNVCTRVGPTALTRLYGLLMQTQFLTEGEANELCGKIQASCPTADGPTPPIAAVQQARACLKAALETMYQRRSGGQTSLR